MVGSCRCLKENLDELRIERVCYERVTGKRKELDDFLFAKAPGNRQSVVNERVTQ
jgi:hypothetical protein